MPLLNWDPEYSVGIDYLDEEHLQLFEMVNELYDSLGTAAEQTVIRQQLLNLAEHTRKHFFEEESLMEKARFPNLHEHRIEHEDLTSELLAFKLMRAKEGQVKAIAFAEFLRDWLTKHILESDRAYASYLQEHGIEQARTSSV